MIPLNPIFQGNGFIFREIQWAAFLGERALRPVPIPGIDLKLNSDTAICQVAPISEEVPHQPLALIQASLIGIGMEVGKRATAIGYGEMRDVNLVAMGEKAVSGDFSFDLNASTGQITEQFPNNLAERQVPAPGPCFSASLKLPGGMSGSPIFDDEGVYVHGVVSKGWVTEHGIDVHGYGSMIAPSLQLPIKQLGGKSLMQLQDEEEHGFPKLQGPGM
jgi:hypothetical protein